MKIYVTQGHEKGIGLEVFLRSLQCVPVKWHQDFCLIAQPDVIEQHAHLVRGISVPTQFIDTDTSTTPTLAALDKALSQITNEDVLLTLPSSKDQFVKAGASICGHTDFLRMYSQNENLTMSFVGELFRMVLLTEHVSLSQLAALLDSKKIIRKLHLVCESFSEMDNMILLGIDPHCGDGGVISRLDDIWTEVKQQWRGSIPLIGPVSADSLLQNRDVKLGPKTVVVSAYHDQGLGLFKSVHGHLGINRTLGLPFVRLSPDHGTAFGQFLQGTSLLSGLLKTIIYARSILEFNKGDRK